MSTRTPQDFTQQPRWEVVTLLVKALEELLIFEICKWLIGTTTSFLSLILEFLQIIPTAMISKEESTVYGGIIFTMVVQEGM